MRLLREYAPTVLMALIISAMIIYMIMNTCRFEEVC